MTIPGLQLSRRLRLYLSMMRYGRAHNRDFAREHWSFFDELRGRLGPLVAGLDQLRVLDVGCGKMMWLTLLLHTLGAQVTGIDTEWVEAGTRPSKYWRILRSNGFERAVRTLIWDLVYARAYYDELASVSGLRLRFEDVDTRTASVSQLDLEDETFDLVVSHEVFEHLPDVDGSLRELHRIMKPEALTYIYIHNYTSLSGGHHIAWKYPDTEPSTTVPPWDHLRDGRFEDIPSWINRWRESQYRRTFAKHFEIVDWIPTTEEGRDLLTPELREELRDYSQEELLTKGFIVVGRRPA